MLIQHFTMNPILWGKMITSTNYKNRRGNFHESFLRKTFYDYKINIFMLYTLGMGGGGGGGGQKKRTFCTLVKMLINVN